MNILVTGATGFIGSHLVKKLLNLKHVIFITVRPGYNPHRISSIKEKLLFVKTDRSLSEIKKTFQKNKIDGIIHLAGYYRKEDFRSDIKKMNETNIDFPLKLISLAKEYGEPFFINTGSCFEYSSSKVSINENSLLKPFNYYAQLKLLFEEKLIELTKNSKMKALTLKLFFPYGERDGDKLVKLLVENIIQKNKFHVTKGEQELGYTYVDDIVSAYILALNYVVSMKIIMIFSILEETQ